MEWIWLGVILSLILIELISMNFSAIWFVVSSIVSVILLKKGISYYGQVAAFLLIGLFLVIVIRPLIIDKLLNLRNKCISAVTSKYPFTIHLIPKDVRPKLEEKKDKNKKSSKAKKKARKK